VRNFNISLKRLGTITHYIGVLCEYLFVVFFALWLNNVLEFPSLFNFQFKVFGFILVIFAVFLIAWSCWLQFKIGQGTTGFSEPTKRLVDCGPYAVVRNPIMLGQFFFFSGIGFFLDIVAMFLVLPVLVLLTHAFVILVEEPNLKRRFGQEWIYYIERVPRWCPRYRKVKEIKDAEL
jgi:protein-S-isoprenylcysteine O-methyltransferase Ste14